MSCRSNKWPEDWPIKQGDFWFCPTCWNAGRWSKLHQKDCTECGFKWEGWFYDFGDAVRIALKRAYHSDFDIVDGCCLCSDKTRICSLTACTECGKESCYGHEVDVLKFFVDEIEDLSQVHLDASVMERVKTSTP